MVAQDRELLGTGLGFEVPSGLAEVGMTERFVAAVEGAARAHASLERDLGAAVAQYVVPLAYRVRWYFRVNLREIYHVCELRTTPQGHPDYRWVAQEMFRPHREAAGWVAVLWWRPGKKPWLSRGSWARGGGVRLRPPNAHCARPPSSGRSSSVGLVSVGAPWPLRSPRCAIWKTNLFSMRASVRASTPPGRGSWTRAAWRAQRCGPAAPPA